MNLLQVEQAMMIDRYIEPDRIFCIMMSIVIVTSMQEENQPRTGLGRRHTTARTLS